MARMNTENFRMFKDLIAKTGNTYAFDSELSIAGIGALLAVIKDMGLDPMNTEEFRKGIMRLFNIELFNLPDLEDNRFILAPNHVSDVDAIILGLLHPSIRIVSKDGWTNNKQLRKFLDIHYDLYELIRTSISSLRALLTDAIRYFNDNNDKSKHYLVFSQGTISDFNQNSIDRISPVAQRISNRTEIPVIAVFLEQVSLYHPTRIVFDKPMKLSPDEDFRKVWLERQTLLQKTLFPAARLPKLSYKHANNNKPGDPFF